MKYFRTFELFDSDELKAQHEIEFIKGEIDKNEITKGGIQLSDAIALNNAIIAEVPVFAYGSPNVQSDFISYEFKHDDIKFLIGISTEAKNVDKFPTVVKIMVNDVEDKVKSNVFDFTGLIGQLLIFQREFEGNITKIIPQNN